MKKEREDHLCVICRRRKHKKFFPLEINKKGKFDRAQVCNGCLDKFNHGTVVSSKNIWRIFGLVTHAMECRRREEALRRGGVSPSPSELKAGLELLIEEIEKVVQCPRGLAHKNDCAECQKLDCEHRGIIEAISTVQEFLVKGSERHEANSA